MLARNQMRKLVTASPRSSRFDSRFACTRLQKPLFSEAVRTVVSLTSTVTVEGVPVLFDIRVLPKSMTEGYSSWWRVGDTEVSENPRNLAAYADHLTHVKDARKY